jgi:hypothetical protein
MPPRTRVLALTLLTALFAGRIAAQAVQRIWPQSWLPAFEAFQGSRLPYWALLSAQLLILIAMVHFSRGVACGMFHPSGRTRTVLQWFGGLYLLGSVARILVGLLVAGAPPWFSTWIPAVFHLALAGWVLTLATADLDSGRSARHA